MEVSSGPWYPYDLMWYTSLYCFFDARRQRAWHSSAQTPMLSWQWVIKSRASWLLRLLRSTLSRDLMEWLRYGHKYSIHKHLFLFFNRIMIEKCVNYIVGINKFMLKSWNNKIRFLAFIQNTAHPYTKHFYQWFRNISICHWDPSTSRQIGYYLRFLTEWNSNFVKCMFLCFSTGSNRT